MCVHEPTAFTKLEYSTDFKSLSQLAEYIRILYPWHEVPLSIEKGSIICMTPRAIIL